MMGIETRVVATLLSAVSFLSGLGADLFPPPMDPAAITVLVSKERRLEYTYEPADLVLPQVAAAPNKEDAIHLRPEAAQALEALFAAAEDAGHALYAVSGYRSYALQKAIYDRKVEAVGEKQAGRSVAPPGASEHQLGLAMDINGESTLAQGLTNAFGQSPEGLWVAENAHIYGFIIRYPEDKMAITGYIWEPWHLRYVGPEVAAEVYAQDITYEEYHQLLQLRRIEAWVAGKEE